MRILVSNDDGYRAEGLQRLVDALQPLAQVTVVAPERNRSGASNSLTLDVPLRVAEYGERRYYVNGTPTDTQRDPAILRQTLLRNIQARHDLDA